MSQAEPSSNNQTTARRPISFKVSRDDQVAIARIVERAVEMGQRHGVVLEPLATSMDITAAHANGCRLRLAELAEADDFDFVHDVMGIRRHIDRRTGRVGGCFVPRYAKAEVREGQAK